MKVHGRSKWTVSKDHVVVHRCNPMVYDIPYIIFLNFGNGRKNLNNIIFDCNLTVIVQFKESSINFEPVPKGKK